MKKKIGVGSISFLLLIMGVLWSINIKEFCLGDKVLNAFGLLAWSNGSSGTHFTIFYSLVFLIPSIIAGYKYPNDLFSKSGKRISLLLTCLLIMCLFLMIIF